MPELHKEWDLGTGREGEESRCGNPIQEDHQDKRKQAFFFLIFICQCWVLSCSMWDLVPWPKTKPRPPAVGAWSLSWWTTREVPKIFFKIFNFSLSFDSHSNSLSYICVCVCVCIYIYTFLYINLLKSLVRWWIVVFLFYLIVPPKSSLGSIKSKRGFDQIKSVKFSLRAP